MLEAVLRPLERPLGASWGPLGASWGPLAGLLGASWGFLGASRVNPYVKLPAAPQPFWLEGPLEPPVGGHFT